MNIYLIYIHLYFIADRRGFIENNLKTKQKLDTILYLRTCAHMQSTNMHAHADEYTQLQAQAWHIKDTKGREKLVFIEATLAARWKLQKTNRAPRFWTASMLT